jgi:4-hydroxy-tetrahydrodipicolinate synthase
MARDAKIAGATAVTLFPPPIFADGATDSSEMPFWLFETVAKRAELPLVVFQFPRSTGLGYTTETLVRLAELPEVVGVKEGSSEMRLYERNVRALANTDPPVPVLTSNNTWLMASLAVGGDGILSGGSNVVAPQHVELWRAMDAGDLRRAQACHDRLYPLVEAFYRAPWINIHTRMKEALVMMGVLKTSVVRPPLIPLADAERRAIREALEAAELL